MLGIANAWDQSSQLTSRFLFIELKIVLYWALVAWYLAFCGACNMTKNKTLWIALKKKRYWDADQRHMTLQRFSKMHERGEHLHDEGDNLDRDSGYGGPGIGVTACSLKMKTRQKTYSKPNSNMQSSSLTCGWLAAGNACFATFWPFCFTIFFSSIFLNSCKKLWSGQSTLWCGSRQGTPQSNLT